MQATSDLEFLLLLVSWGILSAYLVTRVVQAYDKKLTDIIAAELVFYIVALPAFGIPCIVFRYSPKWRYDTFFKASQLAIVLCICVEPVSISNLF